MELYYFGTPHLPTKRKMIKKSWNQFFMIKMVISGQKSQFSQKGLKECFPFWSFLWKNTMEISGKLVPASGFRFCVKILQARCEMINVDQDSMVIM